MDESVGVGMFCQRTGVWSRLPLLSGVALASFRPAATSRATCVFGLIATPQSFTARNTSISASIKQALLAISVTLSPYRSTQTQRRFERFLSG
jgi:hypothetical protein